MKRVGSVHLLLGLALVLAACAPKPAVKPEPAAPPAPPAAPAPGAPAVSAIASFVEHPEYLGFRHQMVEKHGFDGHDLDRLFRAIKPEQRVLDAITRPAEAKPWHQYRRIFVTPERVALGVRFWDERAAEVQRAADAYGVDPEMVVAIIGVETKYGAIQGKFPVLSTLATLAFDYPPRAPFFRGELEGFLLMSREIGVDPLAATGSYAGAMGAGQFMPSSYRAYSRDGDADGKRDLWTDWDDITASVANYFKQHGWERGGLVAVPAVLREGVTEPARPSSLTRTTVGELRQAFVFTSGLDDAAPALYVSLETEQGRVHYVGLNNFWVITRYNRSPLYAMAAHELAREIVAARAAAAGPLPDPSPRAAE